MNNNNNKIKYKLSVEHRLTELETLTKSIIENHFPHVLKNIEELEERLLKKIEKLDKRFWYLITLLIANLVGIIFILWKQ